MNQSKLKKKTAKKVLKKIALFLIDLVFPIKCLGCGRSGKWLCERCYYKVLSLARPTIYPPKNSPLGRIFVPFPYNQPLVQKLIQTYKYHFVRDLKEPLGRLLIAEMKKSFKVTAKNNFVLVPVPLHQKRLRFRGFNQAELIAREVGKYFQIPVKNKLILRIRNTIPQVKLPETKRKQNIHQAFKARRDNDLKNKIILLVDDVYTSGATLEECAKEIRKKNQPKMIWGLTLARG